MFFFPTKSVNRTLRSRSTGRVKSGAFSPTLGIAIQTSYQSLGGDAACISSLAGQVKFQIFPQSFSGASKSELIPRNRARRKRSRFITLIRRAQFSADNLGRINNDNIGRSRIR